ncbi:hypothetical protein PIB30_069724 [Stylosanthes scabra]|uniref:Uncharacterized protein n=1 Tax=Stylosanthes scabra TaxID=79078 RepID=A0ABU6XPL9_9FABA|nr:hypothetical protein [Stylosanthes scabra]
MCGVKLFYYYQHFCSVYESISIARPTLNDNRKDLPLIGMGPTEKNYGKDDDVREDVEIDGILEHGIMLNPKPPDLKKNVIWPPQRWKPNPHPLRGERGGSRDGNGLAQS